MTAEIACQMPVAERPIMQGATKTGEHFQFSAHTWGWINFVVWRPKVWIVAGSMPTLIAAQEAVKNIIRERTTP